jgi:hypothetical protein
LRVKVKFGSRAKRAQKMLPDSYAARQFYSRMDKAGRNPAVDFKQAG